MVEGQSRYGIIEELTQKKIAVRQELANLERALDETKHNHSVQLEKIENEIKQAEGSYKLDFRIWLHQEQVKLQMKVEQHNREVEKMKAALKEREDTYESEFVDWKTKREANMTVIQVKDSECWCITKDGSIQIY